MKRRTITMLPSAGTPPLDAVAHLVLPSRLDDIGEHQANVIMFKPQESLTSQAALIAPLEVGLHNEIKRDFPSAQISKDLPGIRR